MKCNGKIDLGKTTWPCPLSKSCKHVNGEGEPVNAANTYSIARKKSDEYKYNGKEVFRKVRVEVGNRMYVLLCNMENKITKCIPNNDFLLGNNIKNVVSEYKDKALFTLIDEHYDDVLLEDRVTELTLKHPAFKKLVKKFDLI